jgi:hypothetical protein
MGYLKATIENLQRNGSSSIVSVVLLEKFKILGKVLVKCWRYFFCSHKWKLIASNRGNGSKEGEVTLTLFECDWCGKDKVMPSDRTHEKD